MTRSVLCWSRTPLRVILWRSSTGASLRLNFFAPRWAYFVSFTSLRLTCPNYCRGQLGAKLGASFAEVFRLSPPLVTWMDYPSLKPDEQFDSNCRSWTEFLALKLKLAALKRLGCAEPSFASVLSLVSASHLTYSCSTMGKRKSSSKPIAKAKMAPLGKPCTAAETGTTRADDSDRRKQTNSSSASSASTRALLLARCESRPGPRELWWDAGRCRTEDGPAELVLLHIEGGESLRGAGGEGDPWDGCGAPCCGAGQAAECRVPRADRSRSTALCWTKTGRTWSTRHGSALESLWSHLGASAVPPSVWQRDFGARFWSPSVAGSRSPSEFPMAVAAEADLSLSDSHQRQQEAAGPTGLQGLRAALQLRYES